MQSPTPIHTAVRDHYAELARSSSSCCSSNPLYVEQLLKDLPSDVSNFSLGCGDPITLAALKPGETVLDLGSGGGLDCFLAAKQVGEAGHVIGVDMTPDMLAKARASAERLKFTNVEFREGYLEALPVEDASVDVVISNCVINLSPDKPQVFREIYRVLKPGGRVAVSDIVTNGSLPASVQKNMEAWGACIAGALDMKDYVRGLSEAGFNAVNVQARSDTDRALATLPIGLPFSAVVTARKSTVDAKRNERAESGHESALDQRIDLQVGGLEQLVSRVVDIQPIEDGYDLRFAGAPAEVRAMAEAFIQQAGCCVPLSFDVIDVPDGARVRITNKPATSFVAVSDIN